MSGSSRADQFLGTASGVTIAVIAAAAYYCGSLIGLELRLPPATPSVIWPPNAILTTLLLVVPPARWWSVLLGVAGAHFAVQLPVWSFGLVTALLLTNFSEALIAAGVIRYLSDQPSAFNTLRRMSIFLVVGGFLAPFLSTFLDAGVVKLLRGDDYWAVWKMRFLANTLTELAVVPALAGLLTSGHRILGWSRYRWLEAAAITGGLALVTLAASSDAGRIGLSNAPLALFLPLLLWTAVRFGSTGVGLSVLGTVLLAVISTLDGGGLFTAIPADARIRTLQISLICATVPLLCVGALVEERRKAVETLQSNDLLRSSILNSMPSLVTVVDRAGCIIAANEIWQRTREEGMMPGLSGEPGASYLEGWAYAAERELPGAREAYTGIKSVLDGSSDRFALEYCSDSRAGGQWWMMRVVPLQRPDGGAVITHTDSTVRKRAEVEAQQSRDELAHVTRVWAMSELTASLSHQLNQPLTGIMGNAAAGRRFLDTTPPDLVEVRHILTDIIADTQRASDITRAIREMLTKDVSTHELLDLNDIVRDTTALVNSEAIIRNVPVRLQLAPRLPSVRGQRVQLRQVVLNLTLNAMEATTASSKTNSVIVRTAPGNGSGVEVAVIDTGNGLPEGGEGQVFEPFFTTKQSGMGMGLPIARAIIEAHGGSISADASAAGRTIFRFTLPASVQQAANSQ